MRFFAQFVRLSTWHAIELECCRLCVCFAQTAPYRRDNTNRNRGTRRRKKKNKWNRITRQTQAGRSSRLEDTLVTCRRTYIRGRTHAHHMWMDDALPNALNISEQQTTTEGNAENISYEKRYRSNHKTHKNPTTYENVVSVGKFAATMPQRKTKVILYEESKIQLLWFFFFLPDSSFIWLNIVCHRSLIYFFCICVAESAWFAIVLFFHIISIIIVVSNQLAMMVRMWFEFHLQFSFTFARKKLIRMWVGPAVRCAILCDALYASIHKGNCSPTKFQESWSICTHTLAHDGWWWNVLRTKSYGMAASNDNPNWCAFDVPMHGHFSQMQRYRGNHVHTYRVWIRRLT